MRRLRTGPAAFRQVHVWQIPIRQPKAGESPAASACSSNVPPAISALRSLRRKRSAPAAVSPAGASAGGVKVSESRRSRSAAELAPGGLGGVKQGRWPADRGPGLAVDREELAQGTRRQARAGIAPTGRAVDDLEIGVPARELAHRILVQPVLAPAGMVQEDDLPVMTLGTERAQHGHHGRDPAAPTDQDEALGARAGQDEFAQGRAQVHDRPGPSASVTWGETSPPGCLVTVNSSSSRPVCSDPAGE